MRTLLSNKFIGTISLIVCVLMTSCDNREVFHLYHDVGGEAWSKTDTLNFVVDTASVQPGVAYDMQVEMVNGKNYKYQNLWLFVRNDISQKGVFQQDTISMELADKYGNWLGGGFGSFFQSTQLYKQRIVFPEKRNYIIQLIHGMRDEPLVGIPKAGLRISRSE